MERSSYQSLMGLYSYMTKVAYGDLDLAHDVRFAEKLKEFNEGGTEVSALEVNKECAMLTRQVRRLSMFLAMCAGIVDGILVKDEGPEPVLAQVRKVCSIIGISSEDAVAMENAVKLLIAHAPCGKVENVVDEKRAS